MDQALIPIRITLSSTTREENGEETPVVRLMTVGQMRKTPSGYLLRYEETNTDEETDKVTTSPVTLSIQPGRVVMNRKGEFCTSLVFVKDTRFEGMYHTPWGDMGLALFTTQVHTRISDEKGTVHLEYQIDTHGDCPPTQIIHLEYTAEKPC